MRNLHRRHDLNILRLFWALQWLVPLVSMTMFQHRFGYGPLAIFYHLLIVEIAFGVLLGGATALVAVRWLRRRRVARYVLPVAWGLLTVGIYYVYLLAWGGRLGMGMNLRFSWVVPYVLHPSLAISTFAMPPAVFWGILVGMPLTILTMHLPAARALAAVQMMWFVRLRRWRQRTPSAGWRLASAVTLAFVMLGGFVRLAARRDMGVAQEGELFGDPIFASLFEEHMTLPLAGNGDVNAAAGAGYTPPGLFQKKNVILIVIDACRADHLGVLGYRRDTTPFLDALRASGHLRVVRSFYAASCCTYGGMLTLLRARHWFKMTLHAFGLQDVLKRAGYQTHFLLSGDHTHFNNIKAFYGPNVDTYSDGLSAERHYTLNDDRGVFESFAQLAPYDGTPAFLFVHLMSVHSLGLRLPSNQRYFPFDGPLSPETYTNNYDNGIIQADQNLYKIFQELKAKGYLQNSLIVITSDHGESLGERGQYQHYNNLYAEEVQPPLLIYDPEPVTYQNLAFARQVDVAPTILDRLDLPIPPGWDGRSLLRADAPRLGYLRFGRTFAVVDHTPERTLKYIYNSFSNKEEVYDDTNDPHEQYNIISTINPSKLQELRQAILSFVSQPES